MRPPTLEDVLAEQGDLAALCRDRELSTDEICTSNAYYGGSLVLKLYADWPLDRPLKVAIPHGPQWNDYFWVFEVAAPVPAMLVYSEHVLALHRHTSKVNLHTAAPFVYALRVLEEQPKPERRGTLFFHSHSTHWSTTKTDAAALAQRLTLLPADCQPVTVCVYWRDYHLGYHRPFVERGLRVVSAGHIFDPLFLFRLGHLLSVHKYACGTDMGNHIFYAVKAGASYFHLRDVEHTFLDRDAVNTLAPGPVPDAAVAQMETLFAEPGPITPLQLAFVDRYVGAGQALSRDDMRSFLTFSERLDYLGVASWRGELYTRWPSVLARAIYHRPRQIAGKVRRRLRGSPLA